MKIYTLTGDDGTTSLSGGRRVPKHSLRVEAYGSVDELIAWFGLLRDHKENQLRKDILIYIQSQLMNCAAALAYDHENRNSKIVLPDDDCVSVIEKEIDLMEEALTPLKNFILPGGNILVSYCHITRCVCRRAERAVLRLYDTEESPEIVNKFLNRLSDYLFVLSRKLSLELDNQEIIWSV
ncbi:MAG: cob(I)yrinic acid a,c-diamide adenosyltransferase [Bacteroidetes bacterium]|nr:MAG: cob(I)yrinic acid a,c-diamide adenosyltransferase [Bacteroidota bacterium]